MKVNNSRFENSAAGLKSARNFVVEVYNEHIDFGTDKKYAKIYADSFGIENGKHVAELIEI